MLPMMPQLARPAERPLVVERLLPPKDPRTGRVVEYATPIEAPGGWAWTRHDGTVLPSGRFVPRTPEAKFESITHLRHWWYSTAITTTHRFDLLTGERRIFPNLNFPSEVDQVDEDGVPVGFQPARRTKGDRLRLLPYRGYRALALPASYARRPDAVEIGLHAAIRGRTIAGTLPTDTSGGVHPRPFLWRRDDLAPRTLPLPSGYSHGAVRAVNSRGDVVGNVWSKTLAYRVALWPAGGGVRLLPVASTHSDDHIRDDGDGARWIAGTVRLITEDGLVVSQERVRLSPYEYITTLWDGERTMWLPDAIEGVNAVAFDGLRLSADGRGFVVQIGQSSASTEADFGWYRVTPR